MLKLIISDYLPYTMTTRHDQRTFYEIGFDNMPANVYLSGCLGVGTDDYVQGLIDLHISGDVLTRDMISRDLDKWYSQFEFHDILYHKCAEIIDWVRGNIDGNVVSIGSDHIVVENITLDECEDMAYRIGVSFGKSLNPYYRQIEDA